MQIAKYAEKYTKKLRRWIEPLFIEKQPIIGTERCCLSLSSKEISIIRINKTLDAIELISSDNLHYDDLESLPLVLSAFLAKHTAPSTPTYWLLSPEDYQIFLIDALPAAPEEFHEALTWRVRSLINFPIEDAVIDSFELPRKKTSIGSIVAAVTVKRDHLVTLIDVFKKSSINLTTIDIPEMAMRNLTALYEDDEKSTAFIYLYNQIVILNITRQKTLSFTRRFNLPAHSEKSSNEFEQLSLELLRYFDYFQSQSRYPSPTRIFVASDNWNPADIASKLSEYLLLTVEPFRLKSILGDVTKIHSLEQKNLLTLGCALREDNDHVTPRN